MIKFYFLVSNLLFHSICCVYTHFQQVVVYRHSYPKYAQPYILMFRQQARYVDVGTFGGLF